MTTQCSSELLKELLTIEDKITHAMMIAQQNKITINSEQILKRLIHKKLMLD